MATGHEGHAHDKNGAELKAGDKVTLTATVASIGPVAGDCLVHEEQKVVLNLSDDNHARPVHVVCDACCCEKVE